MGLIEFIAANQGKIFISCITYFTFIGHGGVNTLMGSTLLDLQIYVQRTFEATSRLAQARAIGFIIGAAFCSFLDGKVNDCLALSFSTFLSGLFLIVAPWFRSLEMVIVSIVAFGLAQGVFDIYCNVIVLRIWDTNAVNWLQVLHMMYGVGALAVPVLTRPFLLPNTEDDSSSIKIDQSPNISIQLINATKTVYSPEDVRVQYPFLIVGSILIVAGILYMICYLHERSSGQKSSQSATKGDTNSENQVLTKGQKFITVAMVAVLSNLSFGIEAAIGNLTTTFGVKSALHMEKKSAVLLSTVFWTMFSFFRALFIPFSMFLRESTLFTLHLVVILIATFIMVPSAGYHEIITWISFTLLGIGHSPCFSCSFSSMKEYFPVTNKITSIILISGALGEAIHTAIPSTFINSEPIWYLYYIGVLSVVFVVVSAWQPFYLKRAASKSSIEDNQMKITYNDLSLKVS